MTNQTIICGMALIVIGVFGYTQGSENADKEYAEQRSAWDEKKKTEPDAPEPVKKNVNTALIPAAFGGLLLLCAVGVIIKPDFRKHIMHLAAVIGVLGFVGGFVPLIRAGDFDVAKPAARNGLFMALICAIFVYFCIQSFVEARKARQATPS